MYLQARNPYARGQWLHVGTSINGLMLALGSVHGALEAAQGGLSWISLCARLGFSAACSAWTGFTGHVARNYGTPTDNAGGNAFVLLLGSIAGFTTLYISLRAAFTVIVATWNLN